MGRAFVACIAMALAAAPTVAATWYGFGTYEPDTLYDEWDGYQWRDASQDPAAKLLYFNVHQTEYLTGTNLNVGTLGTRQQVPGFNHFLAMFGAWTDCNGDGYVGLAESALVVYPATVPGSCPVGTLHNDGTWVWEYIPLGHDHDNPGGAADAPQLDDPDARVWGDWGLPGVTHVDACPMVPLPHGTTSGTGWMLRYADCYVGGRATGTVNDIDEDGSLGLRFEDPRNPHRSSSALNQHFPESLFGNPETGETGALELGSDDAAFTTWDCSGRGLEVRDQTGALPGSVVVPTSLAWGGGDYEVHLTDADGNYAWIAHPAPALHDPRGSLADGFDDTFGGLHVGGDESDLVHAGGDCNDDWQDGDAYNEYDIVHSVGFSYLDNSHHGHGASSSWTPKTTTDIRFTYWNGDGADAVEAATPATGYYQDAGWSADVVFITTPQTVSRSTLTPQGARYATFYAKVGNDTLAAGYQTPGGEGVYGSEACGPDAGAEGAPMMYGWACDATRWYSYYYTQTMPTVWDVRVGERYHLRDIDCDDGTIARGVHVWASLVLLTYGGPCHDAAD